jgi:thiol:disulfide interchange protein DsbG
MTTRYDILNFFNLFKAIISWYFIVCLEPKIRKHIPMLHIKSTLIALFMIFLIASSALAQDSGDIPDALNPDRPEVQEDIFPQSQPEPPMPLVLRESLKKGAQSKYLGLYHGLHGWVVVKGGKPEFHYVTEDGKAILMGILFDENGNMVTGEQLRMLRLSDGASTYKLSDNYKKRAEEEAKIAEERAAAAKTAQETKEEPKKELSMAEKFYAMVEEGNWIRVGSRKAPVMYAFIDPDCSHCRKFLRDIKPFIDRNVIQLRMLPVGFNESTLRKAAYLLAAPDPEAQIFRYIEGDAEALFVPGDIQTIGATKNIAIMKTFNIEGTPVITYKSSDNKVRFVRGAPDSVALLIDEIER